METMDLSLTKRRLAYFFLFLIAFNIIFGAMRIYSDGGFYVIAGMWGPAMAAILSLRLTGSSERTLPWQWGAWKYNFAGYWIPAAYTLIAYVIVWTVGLGGFPNVETLDLWVTRYNLEGLGRETIIAITVFLFATVIVVTALATALGEEIGWRGFLVPELRKLMSFNRLALLSGFLWALWHWPRMVALAHDGATGVLQQYLFFGTMLIAMGVIMAYLTLKSGSLWPAVILHGAHNALIQRLFTPLTYDTGNTAFWIDELGLAVPIVTVVFAVIVWFRAQREDL